MSVILRGMEMPKNCKSCPLRYSSTGYAWCDITGASLALEIDMRDYTCPLVDIPTPHGDLVDRNELLAEYDRQHEGEAGKARKIMEQAKTVIEAEGSETDA